jgi:hypothetical protein
MFRYEVSRVEATASTRASAPKLRAIRPRHIFPFVFSKDEQVVFQGACVSCLMPCKVVIAGPRGCDKDEATISEMSCCKGPLCSTCEEKQESYCFFCSNHVDERFCVSTRLQNEDGLMAWSLYSQNLVSYHLYNNDMPYLGHFLFSMSPSDRVRLGVTWKRLREIGVRKIYRDFFKQYCDFLKRVFLAKNFRWNLQPVQTAPQPSLFSSEIVRSVAWLSMHKRRQDGEMIGESEQRIPPEFICFCSSRMVVSSHLLQLRDQRKFFSEILRKFLSRFLPHGLPSLF